MDKFDRLSLGIHIPIGYALDAEYRNKIHNDIAECLHKTAAERDAEITALREILGNTKKWMVGPCAECGGMDAAYDGISHEVSCPGCGNYYRDGVVSHTEVIRRWNELAYLEIKLACSRAEKAEAELRSEKLAKARAENGL